MSPQHYPLAFSTLGCPDWTFEHAAEQAARFGYQALEVRLYNGDVIPADLSQGERNKIRQTLRSNNLSIVGLGASTRFAFPDAELRASHLAELRRYLELAHDLGVPNVRTFGSPAQLEISMSDAVEYVAEALNAAAPRAAELGVTILLETHDAFCKGEDVASVMARVSSPHVGAIWDVHHPFRMGESIETTWRVLGPRIRHVHFKDAIRREDGSWQLVLLGNGEVPCRATLELLHREGYHGYIAAEWEKKWHPEIEEPEVALPQHAEVLQEWLAALD